MSGKPGPHKSQNIPFPTKDPRYNKVWYLVNQQGKTLDEALEIVKTWVPGRGGRKPSTSTVPVQGQGTTKTQKDKKKSSPKSPSKNGTVPVEDLLNHPDVPDKVKDKLREGQEDHISPIDGPQKNAKGVQKYSKSTEIVIPVRFDIDTSAIQDAIAPFLTPVHSELREAKPQDISIPPAIEKALEEIGKKFEKTNILLAEIARVLTRIADKENPKPGAVGTVTLKDPPFPILPTATAPLHEKDKPVRATENGLVVGDRVKWNSTEEVGEVIRILPGNKDIEVKFPVLGKKTLLCHQVTLHGGLRINGP